MMQFRLHNLDRDQQINLTVPQADVHLEREALALKHFVPALAALGVGADKPEAGRAETHAEDLPAAAATPVAEPEVAEPKASKTRQPKA